MSPDQKFFDFVSEWAKQRGCTFVEQGWYGRKSPDLIDGMAADDIWGWLLPEGIEEPSDSYFGCVEWSEQNGKLHLEWNTYSR